MFSPTGSADENQKMKRRILCFNYPQTQSTHARMHTHTHTHMLHTCTHALMHALKHTHSLPSCHHPPHFWCFFFMQLIRCQHYCSFAPLRECMPYLCAGVLLWWLLAFHPQLLHRLRCWQQIHGRGPRNHRKLGPGQPSYCLFQLQWV